MFPRRRLLAVIVVIVAVAALVGLGATQFSGGGGSGSSLNPQDVAAARACEAFTIYLDDASKGSIEKADGEAVVDDAGALLGNQAQQESGAAQPKWAKLGTDLLDAVQDVVNGDSASLKTDGTAAATTCHTIPKAAQEAGGYVSAGST